MKKRTKAFAVRIISMVDTLPKKMSADVIGRQVLRAATSVGANYRAAYRARSTDEFRAKLGIVEEEADESLFFGWNSLPSPAS
ncbi:four helix bundle protein [Phragmitibacter flavus]|uniref:four helix bundle protein n=1 Tax=Phragmitibacter flavus TaxID=2576071 RepID=UPI00198260DC|nr:four helix bundle protein [Phragmitibacter flavus]